MLLRRAVLMAAFWVANGNTASGTNLTVCFTPDSGFNMLAGSSTIPSGTVVLERDLSGFDSDLRKVILTREMQLPYELVKLDSYGELQVRTRAGECDIGWGPFYQFSSREQCKTCPAVPGSLNTPGIDWEPYRCCADFSTPYIDWTVSALYKRSGATSGQMYITLFNLFDAFFTNLLCLIFILSTVFAHVIWFVERKGNDEEFPPRYIDGIDDAMWWAAVTVTTVGYGDKTPKSGVGRLIGVAWMVFGLAMFSVLCGHISNRFIELGKRNDIEAPPDLQDQTVCGYPSTFDQSWLNGVRITAAVGSGIADCGEKLRTEAVDSVLMDTPIMQYYRLTTDWAAGTNLVISPALARPLVGLVFAEGSTLRSSVNAEVLKYLGTAESEAFYSTYFPEGGDAEFLFDTIQWDLAGPTIGLIVLYALLKLGAHFKKPKGGVQPVKV